MKTSGFTFLRNATLLGYPYIESIRSLLPLVDEFIVNIGDGSDDTLERVSALADPKIRIIRSQWNERMTEGGFTYSQQKMIAQYNCTGDWAFYLEGDEVLHENDLDRIRDSMNRHLGNPRVEALAFRYFHLYGRTDQVAASSAWYRNEVRIIRNTIASYASDPQFWMVMKGGHGRYPRAAHTGASIYHYGWVRSGPRMEAKVRATSRYWGSLPPPRFDYGNIDPSALAAFSGDHPRVMREWLEREAATDFQINPDYQLRKHDRKHRVMGRLEKLLGLELSKKHYRLVK